VDALSVAAGYACVDDDLVVGDFGCTQAAVLFRNVVASGNARRRIDETAV
jgi:hypothetical protein